MHWLRWIGFYIPALLDTLPCALQQLPEAFLFAIVSIEYIVHIFDYAPFGQGHGNADKVSHGLIRAAGVAYIALGVSAQGIANGIFIHTVLTAARTGEVHLSLHGAEPLNRRLGIFFAHISFSHIRNLTFCCAILQSRQAQLI